MTKNIPQQPPQSEDGENEDEATPRQKSLAYKAWRYAHTKLPRIVPDPWQRGMLTTHRRRDPEKNAKTEPPDGETIGMRCVWAAEFYMPSHTEKLLSGFATLGWDDDDIRGADESPASWIRRLRESSRGGGQFNLGLIERPNERRGIVDHRTAPLPDNVECAIGEVHGLTSSITCVVMCFVLTSEYSHCLEEPLKRKYASYSTKRGRWHRITEPSHQKSSAIRAARLAAREMAAKWFQLHLPGLFSSRILGGEFPTCELTTLQLGRPFPAKGSRSVGPAEYLRLLDMDNDIDAWESTEIKGLKFAWPMLRDRTNRFHAILATNESDIDQEKVRHYGGPGILHYVSYINDQFNGLFSRWSILVALSGLERYLNTTRDSTLLRSPDRNESGALLETLGALISQSGDVSAASSDLGHFAKDDSYFSHGVVTFKPCRPGRFEDQNVELGEVLRQTVADRSAWIHGADRSIRDLLTQYGSATSAWENLKLQRSLKWLTIIATLLTALTAVMTYFTIKSEVKSMIEKISNLIP